MFRRMILTVAALGSMASMAQAEVLFRGTLQFTAVNAACTDGPRVGDQDNARFHPALLPGNNTFEALNQIWNFGATSWRLLASGGFTASFQQTSNASIGWSDFTPDKPTFISVSKQAPAALTATTTNVTLVGKIKNPWGNIGQENCVASFIFVGVKSN